MFFQTGRLQGRHLLPGLSLRWVLWLCLGVIGLLPSVAEAQQNGQMEQLQIYLERNEELLEWAHDLVRETGSVPARRVLQESHTLHQRATDHFGQGRYAASYGLAKRSRAAIWHSVRLGREALSYEERLRIKSERFRDLQSRLMERAQETNNELALDFLKRARHQAERAHEQFNQGQARPAFQLLTQAEEFQRRSARLLAESGGPERLAFEIERTLALIERTRQNLPEDADPTARRLLAEAEEALQRAVNHQEQGQPGRALQMVSLAQRLAGRAVASAESTPDVATITRQIDRWDARTERLSEKLADSGSAQTRRLFERSGEHRQRAGDALAQDKPDLALRQIKAAHDLLNQVEKLLP